ncbi:MAG: hypothetical protein KGJ05_06530, partial [Alphaproteobacteria bacterium]|nr:hypothetical protein [Alphaproteobacteria bacterium]
VNGDTLSGALTTSATPASNVGNYAITQGTLAASSNYTLSYSGANEVITPAPLTITYTATPATSVYGAAIAPLTGTASAAGLVNGDALGGVTTGTASFATTATSTANVGTYAITGSGFAGNSTNYSFSFVQAPGNATAYSITPAPLSVVANAETSIYGAAIPALTYSSTGLVNGDTLSGALTTSATPASNVGNYAITQGTLAASSNYTLSYSGAQLQVKAVGQTLNDFLPTRIPAPMPPASWTPCLPGAISTILRVNGLTDISLGLAGNTCAH